MILTCELVLPLDQGIGVWPGAEADATSWTDGMKFGEEVDEGRSGANKKVITVL